MIATYRIHIRIPRQILFPMSFHMKKWKSLQRVRQAKNYKSIPFTYNINGITFINKITL